MLGVIAVLTAILVPAALAWACGPNRQMQVDRSAYAPGQTVTVSGSNFQAGAELRFTLEPGSQVASTTVPQNTSFVVSFPAPTTPGAYTLRAEGFNQSGESLPGLSSRESFVVRAPQSAAPPAGAPTRGTTPAGPGVTSPTPGSSSATTPGRTTGDAVRRKAGGRSRGEPARSGSSTGRSLNTTAGVIQDAGQTAFAGSVTRQTRVSAATRRVSPASAKAAARPSEVTANGDVWSGFASSKSPSLVPGANDAGAPEAATASGVAWGVALLGAGSLAMLGLGLAEARRRRRATGS